MYNKSDLNVKQVPWNIRLLIIIKSILKLCLLTAKDLQPISVKFKYLLVDYFVPVFYLWGILFFISYTFLNILPLLKINLMKLLEQEYLSLNTVSAILRASAKIPFNKELKIKMPYLRECRISCLRDIWIFQLKEYFRLLPERIMRSSP